MNHHHHHHQFLLSLRRHRASTKHRHLVLFPVIFLTSLQLFPFSNASLWTVLRHVCLGLPLLLFPCGFQCKTSLSMASFPLLSASPIQIVMNTQVYLKAVPAFPNRLLLKLYICQLQLG
jgi:hypothetical protein